MSQFAFISFRYLDLIDILLVAILIYQLYKLIKGTVAIRIFLGILSIYLVWKIVSALQMELLSEILGQFIGVGVLALIIVFQQEIRRFLLLVGSQSTVKSQGYFKRLLKWGKEEEVSAINLNPILIACRHLSKSKTGALMIVAIDDELRYHAATGETIDAKLNSHLIESIFFKNSPMHDGAMVIYNDKIIAARCILPVSDNPDIPASLGLRHRAAIGITEVSNAVAIIVSEETGQIALANKGKWEDNVSLDELKSKIEDFIDQ